MKRKFTYLLTALALLAFLSPTTAWGGVKLADTQRITQKTAHETMLGVPEEGMTREDATITVDFENNAIPTGWTSSNFVVVSNPISNTSSTNGSYVCSTDGKSTATLTYNSQISGVKSVSIAAARTSNNTNGTMTIEFSTSNSDWSNAQSQTVTINKNSWETSTLSLSEASDGYVRINFSGTTAIKYIDNIVITYESNGGGQPTTFSVTYNANGADEGTVPTDNNQYESGDVVTVLGNTGDLAKTNYTWTGWNTAADGSGTDYAAGATFNISANTTLYAKWTANGGSNPGLDIDFESALTTYTDWQFTNIIKTNSDITAHGGTFFGSNANSNGNGTTTASIQTATAIANPQSLTCYVSKRSNNTTSSTWYIQVSSDGTTWTNVSSQSATSMEKGEWVEFTASLTSYSNVYVRIYYSGSSALRAIDDISLTTMPTTPTIIFNPTSISLGNVVVGEQISETFTVSQANLTADIALSALVGSLTPSTILQGAAATQVTWTYTPATAGAINATVTATSGTLSETLNITGLAKEVHNITIASMTNGTVTASPNSAVEGETITLTVTPNTGYTLDALTVTNMTTSQLVNVTNNTFEMPDAPVTVSATFSAIQAMTVAQAITAIDNAANNEVEGAYVRGIISQIDNYSSQYHSITYWISDDGTTATQLQVYSGKGLNGANFNAMTDLAVGDQVVVYGDLKMHNSIYEFNYDNYLYSLSRPSITVNPDVISLAANETDGTTDIAITDIAITDPWEDCHVTFYTDATGATEATQPAWVIDATVAEENNAYLVSCAVYANEGPARTAYFKVYAYDAYQKAVYSNVVTLTQAAVFAPAPTTSGWVLTALEDIVPGDVFVIVGNNGDDYAMTNDNGASDGPAAFSVTVQDDVLTGTIPDNIKWNLSGNAINGYTFYPNEDAESWLYTTNTNDGVRVGTNANKTFTISVEGYLYNTSTSRYIGIYNSEDWRCYTSINSNIADQTFAFYKYSNVTTYTKTIQPYSGNGGYVLIAAPVEGVAPTAANGFLTNNYDLYRFDQSRQEEWLNYKAEPFYLIPGKGYLYANSGNNGQATTLTFTGTPYTGNGQITLTNDANADFAGWNLIGNPYATGMVLKDVNNNNKAFYTLNSAGSELIVGTPGATIAAMEGVFVEATTDGEVVSFVEETGGGGAGGGGFDFISLNVSRNRGASAGSATIDRAIIGIGEGPMLHKLQLNPSNTKIYITEANQDYAVVRSANEAELPVSFRASENGTYTLSVETKNIEMNYLHLIDNMTGADVDLLANPSYTFEVKTSDYASRFRLMFSANSISEDADGDNAFAYFNGSSWTVSNMGEATLQVVDVMGRVLSSEQISGNTEININQPVGVYMLRLVSGDSVKVQKVVVR